MVKRYGYKLYSMSIYSILIKMIYSEKYNIYLVLHEDLCILYY
jgi:hypothetical protein